MEIERWNSAKTPSQLFDLLMAPSERKIRLFLVGCANTWKIPYDWPFRICIDAAEDYCDGNASAQDLEDAHIGTRAKSASRDDPIDSLIVKVVAFGCTMEVDSFAVFNAWSSMAGMQDPLRFRHLGHDERRRMEGFDLTEYMQLFRDIFANPFRPVAFDPRWRTADVVDIARGIYEQRAFERMPILADALMDAGCENDDILAHCKGDGPHVRGCWVVDEVLEKA